MGTDIDSDSEDFLVIDSDDKFVNDDDTTADHILGEGKDMLSEEDIQLCGSGSVIARVDGICRNEQDLVANIVGAGLVKDDHDMKEPYIRYMCSTTPLNSYTNNEYFLGAFPTLFWTGKGGHLEERK